MSKKENEELKEENDEEKNDEEENKEEVYILFGVESDNINKILIKLIKNYIIENKNIKEKNIYNVLDNKLSNNTDLLSFFNNIKGILEQNAIINFIYLNIKLKKKNEENFIDNIKTNFLEENNNNIKIKSFKELINN